MQCTSSNTTHSLPMLFVFHSVVQKWKKSDLNYDSIKHSFFCFMKITQIIKAELICELNCSLCRFLFTTLKTIPSTPIHQIRKKVYWRSSNAITAHVVSHHKTKTPSNPYSIVSNRWKLHRSRSSLKQLPITNTHTQIICLGKSKRGDLT